ncbi:putative Spc97 Spc98 family [Trypanosoma vivax]|uniref:Spindle pole body component n=1 Tax=Trypanosoma vivax (strain Y486) TaxID=1055687 RepID=G0TWQ9_TRYVY|nr:p22 protein precursor [Trypanosoma vivax]KAH8613868.1 putative Spc97 Spc98 family [Trypanosoma vivax]CCC48397.1 p22 protein precursor [Trypanosoma vivax Y486]
MEELQCALLGFSSVSLPLVGARERQNCGDGNTNQVTTTLLQLHPSERSLIEATLPLGAMCRTLRGLVTDVAVGRTNGMYLSAVGVAASHLLKFYEESVRDATTPSSFAALYPKFSDAFGLLVEMVQHRDSVDLLLSSVRMFLCNHEIPQEFRVQLGESVYMSLLYTIGHYVAHGVVLHGRDDFFISVKSKGGKEDHTLHSDLLPSGITVDLGLLILSVGRERRVLLSDAETHGREYLEQLAMGTQDELANRVFSSIYNPSLCVGGLLAVDELEARIEEVQALWSKALWMKVHEQVHLPDHLTALRTMFLCHRGDLWHAFVENAFPTLVDSAVSKLVQTEASTSRAVSVAFACALEVSGLADISIYERFSMFAVFPLETNEHVFDLRSIEYTAQTILTSLKGLVLRYVPPRGLQLIVSAKALEYYQRIFSFHIIRRFSLHALHSVRCVFSRASVANKNPTTEFRRTFAIMQLLLFLQTTLAYYLQVDVIVLQNAELDRAMDKCKSVQDAKRCLDRYVWHITEGSFISDGSSPLLAACESLFQCSFALYVLCMRYNLTSWAVAGSHIPVEVTAALTVLETRAQQEVVAAFTGHLSRSATRANERALWARLDFNGYLSAGSQYSAATVFQQPKAVETSSTTLMPTSTVRRPTASRTRQERSRSAVTPSPKRAHR